jgi:hypothetical protein
MDNYEYEDCSFIKGAFYTIYGLGVVVGGFVLMLWISSWFLKPDDYTPPEKSKVKIEQIKSTTPVINHDVTVETNITVSDGVTKRTMKSKVKAEEVTHGMIKTVNDQMLQATYKIVDDRQREINSDPNYWSRNVINYTRER